MNSNSIPMRSTVLTAVISSLVLASAATQAQTASTTAGQGDGAKLDEIIVTATKTGEANLQSVPIAITSLSADVLENSGVASLRDMATLSPSLQVTDTGGYAQLFLRGVGTNLILAGSDPSTTMHIDGVYMSRPFTLYSQFLDVQRVEVLRGPQGTLYGRNSVGGTINVITREPSDELEGKVQLSAGNFSAYRVSGYVSGPLGENVAGSIAGLYSNSDGRIRNIAPGADDLDSSDVQGFRGKLRFTPTEALSLTVAADYSLDEGNPAPAVALFERRAAFPPVFRTDILDDPYTVGINTMPDARIEMKGVSLFADLQVSDDVLLRSITAYRENEYESGIDTDGTELSVRISQFAEEHSQFSQELQAVYTGERMKAVGGLYYFEEEVESGGTVTIPPANTLITLFPAVQTEPAWAAFARATYDVTDRLSVTGGLRYSKEQKSIDQLGSISLITPPTVVLPYAFEDEIEFDDWTPMGSLDYHVSDDVMLYLSASKGAKSGGFNASARAPGQDFGPESLWAYEAGMKADLLDQRLRLNLAVYHYDYDDLQVQTIIPPGLIVIANAASAEIDGVELEFNAALTENLRLGGYVNYFDGQYGDFIAIVDNAPVDVTGEDIVQAPAWKTGLNLDYRHELSIGGSLFAFGEVAWQDEVSFVPNALLTQDSYALVNARLGYEGANEQWRIAAFVRNAADEEYFTSGDTTPPPGYGGRPGVPRTYGIEVGFDF